MKIEVAKGKSGDADWDELKIDGRQVYNTYPLCECPEDAILGRGLTSAWEVAEWLRAAYECGKSGDELITIDDGIEV